jgi:hypothetical protein
MLHPPIPGTFNHGDTVTITIIDLSDDSVVVNAAVCAEIGSTGDFKYVPTLQKSAKSYLFTMSNGISSQDLKGILEPDIEIRGSKAYTDTITDSNTDPIEGVKVVAYSDEDRNTIADATTTNVNGVFTFHLNPGTYYCRATTVGYSFPDWEKVIS